MNVSRIGSLQIGSSMPSSPVLTSMLLTTLTLFAAQRDPLDEAEKLLRGPAEAKVREGAVKCRTLNSKKSIELLLAVLKDSQPHHRDIVWEELPNFTDPDARKRVEQEIRLNRDNEDVRQWCAELLGLFGDTVAGKTLEGLLTAKHAGVQRAAARSLGQLRYDGANQKLEALVTSKDMVVRANAIEALARIKPDAYRETFLSGLADQDGGVRTALLGALPEIYPELAETKSLASLKDTDWRVCMQAVDNLLKSPENVVVEPLIEATHHVRPTVQQRAHSILRRVTNQLWTTSDQWDGWWKAKQAGAPDNKPTLRRLGETAAPADPASFYGLQVSSDHVVFLIDKSADMAKALGGASGSKSDAALEELDRTLGHLAQGIECNVFVYAAEVKAFSKKPVKLDDRQRKAMTSFVGEQPNTGAKNIWSALSTVMQDPTIDTIYLLSSGEPEVGLYVHHNRVTEHLKDLNRFHRVVIHTVAYTSSQWYRDQIEKIAEATGGQFTFKE